MYQLLLRTDDILRQRRWTTDSERPWHTARTLVWIVVLFGMTYGAVMGCFDLQSAGRLWQVVYSAIKVPLLLFATFALSLPSFYVVNMLFGLGHDFRQAIRSIMASQACVAIVLASLAPLTATWYAGSSRYDSAIAVNGLMFAVASGAGQWILRQNYRTLILKNSHHRIMLWFWLFVYVLVGIQMGWILRPFIGSANAPTQFFRAGGWSNAYLVVGKLLLRILLE